MSERRARVSVAVTALVLLHALGGCSSLIPWYDRPAAPIPATYAQEMTPAARADSVPAADLEPAQFFADPRLQIS